MFDDTIITSIFGLLCKKTIKAQDEMIEDALQDDAPHWYTL